jgi:hypothetical protein
LSLDVNECLLLCPNFSQQEAGKKSTLALIVGTLVLAVTIASNRPGSLVDPVFG